MPQYNHVEQIWQLLRSVFTLLMESDRVRGQEDFTEDNEGNEEK